MANLEIDRLRELVCDAQGYAVARRCCDGLAGVTAAEVQWAREKTDNLMTIYRKRFARGTRAESPEGASDLLERLASADVETDAYLWERDGLVFCVLTNTAATKLVACIVGRDRRVVAA